MQESGNEMRSETIDKAAGALGGGPLEEERLVRHVHPLFSRVLQRNRHSLYLANHSLGRPLDQTAVDVAECLDLWYAKMNDAWSDWFDEMKAFRARTAELIGAPRPDCIVPKMSAGQGLRAVLNTYGEAPAVVSTQGEFDSLDFILKQYAAKGRARVRFVAPRADGRYETEHILSAIEGGVSLVVISHVYFASGQVLGNVESIVQHAHAAGVRVLLDAYHSVGVMPVDVAALHVDFAVGGSYKYLRGGPGACWLYLHPRHLDGTLSTLDTGWFAKKDSFGYRRPEQPEFAEGGDAFLESTPAVLPLFQARAGQQFTIAMGVGRLREYGLRQKRFLAAALREHGIPVEGEGSGHGAFVALRSARATGLAKALREQGIVTDARGEYLRLCPDVLTTSEEMERAALAVATTIAS
jgi:kynureninase